MSRATPPHPAPALPAALASLASLASLAALAALAALASLLAAGTACAATDAPARPGAASGGAPFTVCMAENNAPLSYERGESMRGLDVRIAEAIAGELGRPLAIVPFESKYEADSTLSQEVDALLSSGVCELASGFALLATDLGAPVRPTARVPDYPGAPRPPQRPWVPLRALAPSRAYQAMAMALVVREPARATMTLADPGDARIGAVSGTLAGTAISLYRNGKLRDQTVGIAQNQEVLAELDAGRIDATLTPLARLDAWRLAHPQSSLQRAAYTHPLRINIGFVGLKEAPEPLAAADRVIARALANGDLQRWAEASGATWVAPVEPQVSASVGLLDLLRE